MTESPSSRRRPPAVAADAPAAVAAPLAPAADKLNPGAFKRAPAPRHQEPWSRFNEAGLVPPFTESADRLMHAMQGKLTAGLSPASLLLSYLDWAVHLGNSAGKLSEVGQNILSKSVRFALWARHAAQDPNAEPFIEPLPQDSRFAAESWKSYPFNVISQSFLLSEQWWHYATTDVRGVSRHHQDVVSFTARQLLDMVSPSNNPLTNPEVLKTTWEQGGLNLWRGAMKWAEDLEASLSGRPAKVSEEYRVGETIACSPGKVVFRNRLIELIQYAPAGDSVQAEPILIVPAWIMKYYILDLSPHNSMVKFLVERGFTVFMISWRNPGREERDFSMEDYMRFGVLDSLNAISAITGGQKIHTCGYCLGGTLLSIAAATLARDGDERIKSMTLLAAQTDFEEAGEIMLFIDESQVTFLEDMMWDQGYLDTKQMSGAFQLLRSNDLIWSRMLKEYVLGEPEFMNDLMAWNADTTRMPYRMHSEYLRYLFLDNDLSKGRYQVDGRAIALSDIRADICAVGTTKDHIAPWKSVFKIHILTDSDVTFILTGGGHNAGIVSEPGHKHRSYQIGTHHDLDRYVDPDSWAQLTPRREGSWWLAWAEWLEERCGARTAPPPLGRREAGYPPLGEAPGEYVLQK
ncbi:poly-beta-hydroxybutyrate polymerase [mine drainage metagenome]|uniref:Poly-beta-hydroxybutyrate polymerase n=1 Tax=mine drainage metagenome TaxID=410659 RepID=A0A1J5QCP8_9ZZZZ